MELSFCARALRRVEDPSAQDEPEGHCDAARTFSAPGPLAVYGQRMGHVLFAIALFVGVCLIVEWFFARRAEKKDGRRY